MLSPERSTSHNLFTTVTSKIPDHRSHNKYSNNEKAWNTARITKMRHRANAVCLSKYCWKNGVPWLVPHRVAINFQLTKKKKKKKWRYLWSTIKQIKWDMPTWRSQTAVSPCWDLTSRGHRALRAVWLSCSVNQPWQMLPTSPDSLFHPYFEVIIWNKNNKRPVTHTSNALPMF